MMKVWTIEEIYSALQVKLKFYALTHDLLDHELNVYPVQEVHRCYNKYHCCATFDGKESILEANFLGSKGHAFVNQCTRLTLKVRDLLNYDVCNPEGRSVFISGLNAIFTYLNICSGAKKCTVEISKKCASTLIEAIPLDQKILLVGVELEILKKLSLKHDVRVVDMDYDNIWEECSGVMVEHYKKTLAAIGWCDKMIVTGSTLVNGTIPTFINQRKPVTFLGVTISATSKIMGLDRFCIV